MRPVVGIIGGTGLGEALTDQAEGRPENINTPFGATSSPVLMTAWDGMDVAFISRHGEGHTIGPSRVPSRANTFALKTLGVTHVIASGATGSLRDEIRPRDLVIPDQVIDKTFKRDGTFFDQGLAVHVELAEPFCRGLRGRLLSMAHAVETVVHDGGTYVCMEGPQFSTVAESRMHRAWGGDLIGMTCMPEAKLAREAEMCYALVALPTDYECWRSHEDVKDKRALLEEILGNLQAATENAIRLIKATVADLAKRPPEPCRCHQMLELAIWSAKDKIDPAVVKCLEPIVGKYFKNKT